MLSGKSRMGLKELACEVWRLIAFSHEELELGWYICGVLGKETSPCRVLIGDFVRSWRDTCKEEMETWYIVKIASNHRLFTSAQSDGSSKAQLEFQFTCSEIKFAVTCKPIVPASKQAGTIRSDHDKRNTVDA
jgi:hypothetical protein